MVYACLRWISHGPMCTPSEVANPCFFVSSRRKDIWSSAKWQVSHAPDDAPEPADVMQVPFNDPPLVSTGERPMNLADPAAVTAALPDCSRMTGLKATRPMCGANSCEDRNSRSAG